MLGWLLRFVALRRERSLIRDILQRFAQHFQSGNDIKRSELPILLAWTAAVSVSSRGSPRETK